jgi:hypothetical protein
MRLARGSVLALLVFVMTTFADALPARAERLCRSATTANTRDGGLRIQSFARCDDHRADSGEAPPTRVVDCGPPSTLGLSTPATSDDPCRTAKVSCAVPASRQVDPAVTTLVVIVQRADKVWVFQSVNCAARVNTLTPVMIRAQVIRLVPAVPVRSAPVDGYTLVNMKTVLWVETPPKRPLGPVTLLGHRVQIQIAASSVRWNFGDGTAVDGPLGQPFSIACSTRECPGFWGHDYTRSGKPVVTAAVSWTARYAVDGGAWAEVPGGVVTGAVTARRLVVREARAVLVPDPNGW